MASIADDIANHDLFCVDPQRVAKMFQEPKIWEACDGRRWLASEMAKHCLAPQCPNCQEWLERVWPRQGGAGAEDLNEDNLQDSEYTAAAAGGHNQQRCSKRTLVLTRLWPRTEKWENHNGGMSCSCLYLKTIHKAPKLIHPDGRRCWRPPIAWYIWMAQNAQSVFFTIVALFDILTLPFLEHRNKFSMYIV